MDPDELAATRSDDKPTYHRSKNTKNIQKQLTVAASADDFIPVRAVRMTEVGALRDANSRLITTSKKGGGAGTSKGETETGDDTRSLRMGDHGS